MRSLLSVSLSIFALAAIAAAEGCLLAQSVPVESGPSTRPAMASQPAPPPAAPQRVLNVTTLQDYGPGERPIPGSIRFVLERARGPAIVRFTVGGGIHLKNKLVISTPYLAIDGSAAPAPGITFYQHQVEVLGTHHVVLRHLRFRCGDGFPTESSRRHAHGDYEGKSGHASGGWRSLLIISDGKRPTHDVLVENCSIQNSTDDNGSVWDDCRRITFRRCLFSGGYASFTKGLLVGSSPGRPNVDDSAYVIIYQCLFAFMKGRAPDVSGGIVQVTNNVICGSRQGGLVSMARGNFVNNYFLTLQDHPWGAKADRLLTTDLTGREGAYYLAGNTVDGVPGDRHVIGVRNQGQQDVPDRMLRAAPWPGLPDKLLTADEALRAVLENAGCTVPVRDDHDRKVIQGVRERVGVKD